MVIFPMHLSLQIYYLFFSAFSAFYMYPHISFLWYRKNAEGFSQKIYKILSSRKIMLLFVFPLHYRKKPDFRGSFWKLFWDFRKWTFINVQN